MHFWSQQQNDTAALSDEAAWKIAALQPKLADTKRELNELRREIARNADISKQMYELRRGSISGALRPTRPNAGSEGPEGRARTAGKDGVTKDDYQDR